MSPILFEKVLAAVRAGLLSAVSPTFPDGQPPISASRTGDAAAKVPPLPVGVLGHADILREASHYLSAIKVCFAPVCSFDRKEG